MTEAETTRADARVDARDGVRLLGQYRQLADVVSTCGENERYGEDPHARDCNSAG
jgi:hypothetical protein